MTIFNLSKREKLLLALLAVLFLLITGYRHIYRPLLAELKGLEAKVAKTEGLLARKSQLLDGSKDIEEEYRRKEETYQELLKLLPDNKDLPTLLLLLEGALVAREVSLLSLESLGAEREGDYALYSLRLNLRGSYGDIAAFLEELAAFPRLVRPVELNLFGGGAGTMVQANLYLEAFYLPGDGEKM